MAALVQSTLVPREQKPCLSGGATDIIATSISITRCLNSLGISLMKIGMASALPSSTALRAFGPRSGEFERNIPGNNIF